MIKKKTKKGLHTSIRVFVFMSLMIMNLIFLLIMKKYFSISEHQRPFGGISGIMVLLVIWFE